MKKRCPQCGQIYTADFTFCQNDGADLIPFEAPATPPVVAAPAAPAAPPTAAPVQSVPSHLANNRPLMLGAIAAGLALLLGGGMFISGNQSRQRAAEELRQAEAARTAAAQITPQPEATSEPSEEVPPASSETTESAAPIAQPTATRPPKPTATPDTTAQERAEILQTVDNWRSAWEQQNTSRFMSNYAPDAQIYSNKKWYSYGEYESHERELFSYGGTIEVTRGKTRVNIEGNTATVSFPLTFQRWGGKGNYRSKGRQKFKLRKDAGQWVIYEDVFTKS